MHINTKAIFEWDNNLKQYVEIHNEGYEYEGELELALRSLFDEYSDYGGGGGGYGGGGFSGVGANQDVEISGDIYGMSPAGTYGTNPSPAYEYSPGYGQFSNVFGESGLEHTLMSLYNIDPDVLTDAEKGMLAMYDPTAEQGFRQSAISDVDALYGASGRELFKTRQAATKGGFAGSGDTSGMDVEDIYEGTTGKRKGTLLDLSQAVYGKREDWATNLESILQHIETMREEPIPRVGEAVPVYGCMDTFDVNYDPDATHSDNDMCAGYISGSGGGGG